MLNLTRMLALGALAVVFHSVGLCADQDAKTPLFPPTTGPVDGAPKPTLKQWIERHAKEGDGPQSSISADNFAKLDTLYAQQLYSNISLYLSGFKSDKGADAWLTAKAAEGSVPMMWLLADRYASVQTIDMAVKWGYTALLGTMQERALCLDPDVEYAIGKTMQEHSRIMFLDRSNPFMTKDAKLFAMDTLAKASHYPHPTPWLCKPFSSKERLKGVNSLYSYDEIYFPHLRAKARNALRAKYQIRQPPEPLPDLPNPAQGARRAP